MGERSLVCAILRVLVSSHAYGKPIPQDVLLSRAAYPAHRGGDAKDAYEATRELSFIEDYGTRGIRLDTAEFAGLVQFLYDTCDWDRFELELRITRFEGWEEIDWETR